MSGPLVSIMIPVYNREILIRFCIDSALAQTEHDIEVVVVDNASTDGTWDVCQEYARLDSRVRVFRNDENIGPVRNWLRCVSEAQGRYGKILFSDDLMAKDYLEKVLPSLRESDVAFVFSSVMVGGDFHHSVIAYAIPGKTLLTQNEYLSALCEARVPVSPSAAVFRLADIRRNLRDNFPTTPSREFWRHGSGPDVMLYALTARNYPSVACINEPLVLFRSHPGSLTITNENNQVVDGYRAALSWFYLNTDGLDALLSFVSREWIIDIYRSRKYTDIGSFLRQYHGSGSFIEQFRVLTLAIRHATVESYRRLQRLARR